MAEPEPLKGKGKASRILTASGISKDEVEKGLKRGMYIELFELADVRSAVEWYKKYESNWRLFEKDYPEMYNEFIEDAPIGCIFNHWLLDKAFADVMDKKEGEG